MNTNTMLHLCIVDGPTLKALLEAGEALDVDALALDKLSAPAADLVDDAPEAEAGWLPGLAKESGAPLTLEHFELAPRQAAGVRDPRGAWELDAFALCSVYERVVWDDRAPTWHNTVGRPKSHDRLRKIHDLALRAWRNSEQGERLVMLEQL
ncbi:MAG: hypothetical protein ACE366_12720 [Bradymonadia bacterium]